ncbi:hypothetical protein ES705_14105 [subsurface metagenome]
MSFHCHNSCSGSCSDPKKEHRRNYRDGVQTPTGVMFTQPFVSRACKLDPATCGFFISWKEERRRYDKSR